MCNAKCVVNCRCVSAVMCAKCGGLCVSVGGSARRFYCLSADSEIMYQSDIGEVKR